MEKYYSLETAGKEADLYIFGEITSWPWNEKDKDAYGIVKELQELEVETVNVHINSYGGDVAEGLAIYNVLKTVTQKCGPIVTDLRVPQHLLYLWQGKNE